MDPNKNSPSNSIEKVDYQLESSSKLAADAVGSSSQAPVFNEGKLKVKLKINNPNKSSDQEEIEGGAIMSTPQVVMKNSNNNIHQCSECSKVFQSGKALGGHMSSAHVQAGKDYNKKMKLKKSMKFKNHEDSALNNVCSICGKNFPSRKSLHGHMRCHPDRDWRGVEPPINPPMDQAKKMISSFSISAPFNDYSDDDDQSLETVYLNESAALAAANVVISKGVDFTDSLMGWSAKGRRGRKGRKSTCEPPLPAGLELLVNVANGDSLSSSESETQEKEVEAISSNSPTLYAADVPDMNNGMINSKSKRQRLDVFPAKRKWDFPGNRKDEIQGLNGSSKSKIRPRSDDQVGPESEKRDISLAKKLISSNGGIEDDVNGVSNHKSKFSQRSEQELHSAEAERRDFPVRSLKSSERRSRDASEKGKEKARKIYGGKGKEKAPNAHEITSMMIYGGKGISLMKQGFSGMKSNGKGMKFRATSESESTESDDKKYYLNGKKYCSANDEPDHSMNTDDDQLQQQHQKYSEGNQIKVMVKNKKKSGKNQKLKPVNSEPSADHHQGDHDHHDANDHHPMAEDTPEKHICSTCHKSFPSHQALGGHRSSHNKFKLRIFNAIDEISSPKIRSNPVSPKVLEVNERSSEGAKSVENNYAHKCKICDKNFPTDQALGGHKRCHWSGGSSSSQAASPEEDSTQISARKVLKFDLNEMPNMEDGDGKDNENGDGHASLS